MNPHGAVGASRGDAGDRLVDEIVAAVRAKLRGGSRDPVILAGGTAAGKTTTAQRVAERLREAGVTVGGFVAPRRLEGSETVGYRLVDLQTGETREFASVEPPGQPVGRFYVTDDALRFARSAVTRAARTSDVVFIDEVGRWELDGGGHADSVRLLCASDALPILLVRDVLVDDAIVAFDLRAATVFSVGNAPIGAPDDRLASAFWAIVDEAEYPLFVTLGGEGFPEFRPMDLVERDGAVLWFPTSRASRKVKQIEAHPQVTVLFVETDRFNYASFHGTAAIVTDAERSARLWREEWRDDWPLGPGDPDYVLIRVDGVRGYYLHGPSGEAGEIDLRT